MIFNSNTTSLAASNIPMAEGYDCSYGAALALVEGARNDYNMFKAMLDIDARELQIKRESNTSLQESEMTALNEAALSGIWNKIKELFTKLIGKIKAIFHTFMSKINSLFMKDKEMVKKYEKEILRKNNIGNLEVKWRKSKNEGDIPKCMSGLGSISKSALLASYKDDADDRNAQFLPDFAKDPSSFESDFEEHFLDDEETVQIKEISGGIRGILTALNEYSKNMKDLEKFQREVEKGCNNVVKEADTLSKNTAKGATSKNDDGSDKVNDDQVAAANHIYTMATIYQTNSLKTINAVINIAKIEYQYTKAAFMKAIAANDKKLEEEAIYLNAVAEAAEEEVEDVINGAIDAVDVTNTNNASTNVLDANVSNDPDKLVYADDPEYKEANTDGSIGTDYVSKEAAFFAQPLY